MAFIPSSELRIDDLPDPAGVDDRCVAQFASTFDGYVHFGSDWGDKMNVCRQAWQATGVLPDDVDALRACLALEHRRERFVDLDVVGLSEPDERGVRTLQHGPTSERDEHERYKRALVLRIVELVRAAA